MITKPLDGGPEGKVYWFQGALYTPAGYLIVNCSWAEARDALLSAATPLTLLRQAPPTLTR